MALVVFMRAVNVGSFQRFSPAKLAKDLADLEVSSIGAAGTFVVRGKVGPAKLRAEIARRLKFTPEMLVRPGSEVRGLVDRAPFGDAPLAPGVKRFVTVLAKDPGKKPNLPMERPSGASWDVRIVEQDGAYLLSLSRRGGRRQRLYPNHVIEDAFGVSATTRGWETLERVAALLTTA